LVTSYPKPPPQPGAAGGGGKRSTGCGAELKAPTAEEGAEGGAAQQERCWRVRERLPILPVQSTEPVSDSCPYF